MAESPQFETLVQSLSSTLQSLEQKRKELKKSKDIPPEYG